MDVGEDSLDAELQRLRESGDPTATATRWLEALGPEIWSFLAAMPIDGLDTDDLFADFSEKLWRSLPGFRWECSARTWSYVVARGVWQRALTRKRRAGVRPLTGVSELSAIVERVRTSTAAFQRTEVKDEFRALRDELAPDDRMLLLLRVDRGLDWTDAARVLQPDDAADDAALAKHSARLRKQFQRIKTRIRTLARERGLLAETDEG